MNKTIVLAVIVIAVALGIALSQVHLINLPAVPSPWSLLPRDTQIAMAKIALEGCQRTWNVIRH